ncbi:hypothetical protein MMC24_003192 [Lignoscripta atroalba]|nr:hypothetical protein [Lignoscripta atroalba]
MPATDSPAIIVARFLKANHYNDTLDAFVREAGLPLDAGTVEKGDLTIERILEEKKVFDVSVRFERVGGGDGEKGWSLPAPSNPITVSTLPTSTNLLHVSVESFEDAETVEPSQILVATTADRRLNFLAPNKDITLLKSNSHLQDSPILSCKVLGKTYLTTITTGMSGQVLLYNHAQDTVLEERRDHKKYVVKVTAWEESEAAWVATAGWDAKVLVYRLSKHEDGHYRALGPPVASLDLPTNPETVLFLKHPDSDIPILLVTRRDSTSLHYYNLPPPSQSTPTSLQLLGRQNLAPHSNAWIAFSPSSVALCPTDPTLLAVATSAVPHMKLLLVRLLLPPLPSRSSSTTTPTPIPGPAATQAAQTLSNLAIQDREDAAILIHASTLAPQTPYSTPQVCWRPDGSGVWVNGDDGVLRGVEARTGKIVTTLKGGHEVGSKIRSIWAGWVDEEAGRGKERKEWVVSGGFDRRLVVWKVNREDEGGELDREV